MNGRLARLSRAPCIAAAVSLALCLPISPAAFAQTAAPEKIAIMVGGMTKLIYLPVRLTERLGYFKDEGLDVELLSQPAGVDAENELLAGAVQGVVGFYDHTITLQSRGKEVKAIVVFGQVPGEVVVIGTRAARSIGSMADVKGKTLGVTGLGSSTHFLTRYLAERNGVPPSLYTVLPVGAGSSFVAALREGRIDGGMTTEPTVSRLLKSGEAEVLVDMRDLEGTRAALGGAYPASSLYMESAWLKTHPQEAAKLARAFVRTLRYMHTHSAEEIAAQLPREYVGDDHALFVRALKASIPTYTTDGRMPADGPPTVLDVLSSFNSSIKKRHVDLSRTFTKRFVDGANP
jgi:NitT/TauT family transport system substrate-binding protein